MGEGKKKVKQSMERKEHFMGEEDHQHNRQSKKALAIIIDWHETKEK